MFITCRKKLFTRNNSQTSFGFISLLQKTLPISKTQQRVCCACLHNLRRVYFEQYGCNHRVLLSRRCGGARGVFSHSCFRAPSFKTTQSDGLSLSHHVCPSLTLPPPHLPPPPSNLLLVHALVLSLRLSSPLQLSCLC